ncbi:MAG: aminomethyl-transferring glycine dehydrogenase subunit GcvPB [Bacteriovoracaceae bacterium]
MTTLRPSFNYDPKVLPRELKRHYIGASEEEINEMLKTLGLKDLSDLYSHIPKAVHHKKELNIAPELSYEDLAQHLFELSSKNKLKTSFLGDGLQNYRVTPVVDFVCSLRGLTTAYTPYQPERSQGTLQTLWIYQSLLSMLTGFEAINASMYERSSAMFEAMNCALRLVKEADTIIVANTLYPNDIEVLKTHANFTKMKLVFAPMDATNGLLDLNALKNLIANNKVAAIAFPQTTNLGLLENVDAITDLCSDHKIQSIVVFDPMLLGTGGLKAPVHFGSRKQGADMVVGEGQHLAIGPNAGGPGLGIFGIRFNEQNKNSIRATAGRFVGKAKDFKGRECKVIVLSTREQHIRREKANSNICSNQSFVATIAGASLLARGEEGLKKTIETARQNALFAARELTKFKGVRLKYGKTAFFNEFALELPVNAEVFLKKAEAAGFLLGVDVTNRITGNTTPLILMSFNDIQTKGDIEKVIQFFKEELGDTICDGQNFVLPEATYLRTEAVNLPNMTVGEIKHYYQKLADQNVSPDDNIYPLGSCTMKYNPYINDWAASLKGFTDVHPEAPFEDIQGVLEVIYHTQEIFKEITGLAGVTTEPVAGAQGELVGIKMFQGYHAHHGQAETRDIILIPQSAHGTNPATASMAGFDTKVVDGKKYGIVLIEALATGQMNLEAVKSLVSEYGQRIAGIMVTNPNTSGIFEVDFKTIADLIHSVGGLVYMDGANMNAIAGWIDLGKMGVDAVHNNTHKTWTIPHGGGGPGDAFVAVSEKLVDFLPGIQVIKKGSQFEIAHAKHSIGTFHRHMGNFAHKVRAYTYLRRLGPEGVKRMSALAVLSARYLYHKLSTIYPVLPVGSESSPRMHEFIVTLPKEAFSKVEAAGTPKANTIARVGKLFLDFGMHAPTVAFPEVYGLMIEPTETYTKKELDRFTDVVTAIYNMVHEHPEVLKTVPHFTPIDRVDEVEANKNLILSEKITKLAEILPNRMEPHKLSQMGVFDVCNLILEAHKNSSIKV